MNARGIVAVLAWVIVIIALVWAAIRTRQRWVRWSLVVATSAVVVLPFAIYAAVWWGFSHSHWTF